MSNAVDDKEDNDFTELESLDLRSQVKIVGKVKSKNEKRTRDKVIHEVFVVNSEMKEVKVTVFGNIPKVHSSGLKKGCVVEVSGIINVYSSARYVGVDYKVTGSWLKVLPKGDPRTLGILSAVGKKRKSKGDISKPADVKTIKQLKEGRLTGQFQVKNCIIKDARPNSYDGCSKCSTKMDGDACKKPSCKSKKKKKTLRMPVTIVDDSTIHEKGVQAVMFGDVAVKDILGLTAATFMKKTYKEKNLLCRNKYIGNSFLLYIEVKPNSWVINKIQKE